MQILKTDIELECELLKANHTLKHAKNNVTAFGLIAQIAKTDDAKRDAEGSKLYWERQVTLAQAEIQSIDWQLRQVRAGF